MLWGAEKLVPAEYWCPYGMSNLSIKLLIQQKHFPGKGINHKLDVWVIAWLRNFAKSFPCLQKKEEKRKLMQLWSSSDYWNVKVESNFSLQASLCSSFSTFYPI